MSDCLFFLPKAGDTRHRNWYQKLVTETVTRNLHEKFDTSSSQLITVFGARKMADNIVDAAAALTAVSAATLGLLLEANEKKDDERNQFGCNSGSWRVESTARTMHFFVNCE